MRNLLLPFFLAALDIISTIIVIISANYLRFDGQVSEKYLDIIITQLPIFCLITISVCYFAKLYSRIWKYAGSSELLAILFSAIMSSCGWFVYSYSINRFMPRSTYIIAGLLLVLFIGGIRFLLRVYYYLVAKYFNKNDTLDKVLIVGAGDAGATLVREIEQYHSGNRQAIGFVDDDKSKIGRKMFGVKVLGSRIEIPRIVNEHGVKEIIIAMPSVKGNEIREIISICKKTGIKVTILPGIYEIIEGTASVSQLRDVQIEDLLGRDPVKLDDTAVSTFIKDKIVLVTGAGGSIGSEICRQVARMSPKKIVLLGKGENSVYEIWQELIASYPELDKIPVIADIRDEKRINQIFREFNPQVVFHAGAHKHVPLMEYQPVEAVKNNVWGTKVIAEAADKYGVESFVMISTDKAVNPTSVMGCTKRVAEMYVQSMNSISNTRFVAVRFGNVLGSRGSVIPLFKKQIAKGGPVTLTHPEMKRYFMTIPEASQLVLQAGAMAKGGEVFVLDMGEPVKIYDLARDLITLSGLIPEVDIPIKITGLRPGEKLFEELLSAEDGTERTAHNKIFTAKIKDQDKSIMDENVLKLLDLEQADDIVRMLKNIVPTYTPNRENLK